MASCLYVLMLFAASAVAQTVEGSVFNAATGTGAGGVKVELLKGATPFYETTADGGAVSASTIVDDPDREELSVLAASGCLTVLGEVGGDMPQTRD